MRETSLVRAPSDWTVTLAIRPQLLALVDAESRRSGRSVNEILVEAIGEFLRAHPVSLR